MSARVSQNPCCTACGSPMQQQIDAVAIGTDLQSFKCPHCRRVQKHPAGATALSSTSIVRQS
jgi:hypothetical protein